jgi:hypothetical protein
MAVNITSNTGAALTWNTDGNTWATDPYTWATANATAWSLTATEGWNNAEQKSTLNGLLFAESWHNAELKFANSSKKLFEGWNNAETVTHVWQDFMRVLEGWATGELASKKYNPAPWTEGWHNSELKYNTTAKSASEGWTTSDAITKNPISVHNEAWNNAELLSKSAAKKLLESWTNIETIVKIVAKFSSEGWNSAENLSKSPISVHGEGWHSVDLVANSTTKKNIEGWTTAEIVIKFFAKLNLEATHFIELWFDLANYHLNIAEAWANAELAKKGFTKTPFTEGWMTADSDKNLTNKHSNEGWTNSESVSKVATKVSPEGWATTNLDKNSTAKMVAESWTTLDSNSKKFVKDVLETWANSEVFSKVWNIKALISELWKTTESIRERYGLNELEAFQTIDAYLKNANAVISDLAFASGDLTVADFLNMNSPVGYGPFNEFVPGELEYQKALIAIILEGPLTTGRPQINDWQLTVDVQNQTDSGTLTLPAANTFVPFNARFYAPPQVMVQLRGGSSGTPDITNITDIGFNVEIDNAADQPIAGDIVWSATGY